MINSGNKNESKTEFVKMHSCWPSYWNSPSLSKDSLTSNAGWGGLVLISEDVLVHL